MAATNFGALTQTTNTAWSNTPSANPTPEPQPTFPEPVDKHTMNAVDFVLWLNGAIDVLDDTPPTQSQWNTMRERIAGQVGAIVAHRIRVAARPTNPYATPYVDQTAKMTQLASAAGVAQIQQNKIQLEDCEKKVEECKKESDVYKNAVKALFYRPVAE